MSKPLIHWNEDVYSVGLRKMDGQHKQLIGLINALAAQQNSKDHAFVDRVFTTLITYTKQHFVDEERLLKKLHFPHFDSHHQQHLSFIEKLHQLKLDYDKHGASPEMLDKLTQFLSDWLNHHILVEDKAYCTYLEG